MSRETNGIRMVPQFQTKQRGVRHLDTPMRTLTGCTVAPRLWQMTWQNPEIFGLGSQVHCPTIAWSQDSCHREFAPGDLCSRTPRAAGGVEGLHEGIGCCFLDAGDGGSRLQLPSGTVFLFLPSYYIYIVVCFWSLLKWLAHQTAGTDEGAWIVWIITCHGTFGEEIANPKAICIVKKSMLYAQHFPK